MIAIHKPKTIIIRMVKRMNVIQSRISNWNSTPGSSQEVNGTYKYDPDNPDNDTKGNAEGNAITDEVTDEEECQEPEYIGLGCEGAQAHAGGEGLRDQSSVVGSALGKGAHLTGFLQYLFAENAHIVFSGPESFHFFTVLQNNQLYIILIY